MIDNREELISKIIKLELEITSEVSKGHKPYYGDHLEAKRTEVNTLRCILYGYNSLYCKKNFVGTK